MKFYLDLMRCTCGQLVPVLADDMGAYRLTSHKCAGIWSFHERFECTIPVAELEHYLIWEGPGDRNVRKPKPPVPKAVIAPDGREGTIEELLGIVGLPAETEEEKP